MNDRTILNPKTAIPIDFGYEDEDHFFVILKDNFWQTKDELTLSPTWIADILGHYIPEENFFEIREDEVFERSIEDLLDSGLLTSEIMKRIIEEHIFFDILSYDDFINIPIRSQDAYIHNSFKYIPRHTLPVWMNDLLECVFEKKTTNKIQSYSPELASYAHRKYKQYWSSKYISRTSQFLQSCISTQQA